ncbi:RNA polymerase sigma factor SigF, partial [Streptomyces sp. NPDC005047]
MAPPVPEAQPQEPETPAPPRSRGADTRALTQVLFGEL